MSIENANKELIELSQKATLPAEVHLYTLDASEIGGGVFNFYPGTDTSRAMVKFRDTEYLPFPVEASGFEYKGSGELPRPNVRFSNISRFFSEMVLRLDDLTNAKFTRLRTWETFLQRIGVTDNPQYDPEMCWPPDIYYVNQKKGENKLTIEFELVSSLELDGAKFPHRLISANFCPFHYRGSDGCNFAETRFVATENNTKYNGRNLRWRRDYNAASKYFINDAVGYLTGGYYRVYRAVQSGFVNVLPTNTAYWIQEQRYTGLYNAAFAYAPGDVIYSVGKKANEFYVYIGPNGGTGKTPPNPIFWLADRCSKQLEGGCYLRFDPENRGNTLRFGGFPGTSTLAGAI